MRRCAGGGQSGFVSDLQGMVLPVMFETQSPGTELGLQENYVGFHLPGLWPSFA